MSDSLPPRHTLESLKKEAKRWLTALEAHDPAAEARFRAILGPAALAPSLRNVQLALAREHGYAGWTALKVARTPDPAAAARSLKHYEDAADALLEAYQRGTPDALERHYSYTWHRREWSGMRRYVQLDLGRRPEEDGGDGKITLEDARYLVAREYGFDTWDLLRRFTASIPAGALLTAKPTGLFRRASDEGEDSLVHSRDWTAVLRAIEQHPDTELAANGQVTDAMLGDLARRPTLSGLNLEGSQRLTDAGVAHLARFTNLRRLDLSGTGITDQGLAALSSLEFLEELSLAMTRVTDAGMRHLSRLDSLRRLNLMWTATGDGAIRAMAGKPRLAHLQSGNRVTDDGLPMLHDIPVFKRWHGGEAKMALLSYDAEPNRLLLRGPFTDAGLASLRGLDGLFGLNLNAAELAISARGIESLGTLPHLGHLAVDPKDDWMPVIAALPVLRFLGAQDTTAGDDGFIALSKSRTLEYFWGRRAENLGRRGFEALSTMPSLRGIATSLKNVGDAGLSALPAFPALRELMPVDAPDEGYHHVGRCRQLESLILMYCRETTDAATERITGLEHLSAYFNSYTTITDRTPALLATMPSLERITFDACHNLTDDGIRQLRALPRLKELRVAGSRLTAGATKGFRPEVKVFYDR